MPLPPPSLKARALRFLAAREHSRLELRRKLARHCDDADEIERVLDELAAQGWLSAERFVESVLNRRAAAQGTARIKQELQRHGVDKELATAALAGLAATESERALGVWRRRFGAAPADAKERAKQIRFLQARGFSAAVIRTLLSTVAEAMDAPEADEPEC